MLEEVSKRSEVALERDDSYEQLDEIDNATDRMLLARALDTVAPQTRAMSEPERRMIAAELGIGRNHGYRKNESGRKSTRRGAA